MGTDTKRWWESKTIWVQVVGLLFVALSYFGELPEGLTEEGVTAAIMGVVGILTIIFRANATAQITKAG